MKKVALIDGQTIQAIPVAASLKRLGYYTILFCDTKKSYGYRTRYADKKIISPSTQNEITNFHKFFVDYIKNEPIDITIPLNDFSARYLSLNSDVLKPFTSFLIPSYDIFMTGYDKNKLMKICQENKFPHPKSFDLSFNKISEAAANIGFPALIKPNETTGARGFAIVNSEQELKEKLPIIINGFGNCHLQEFIPPGGKQFKVELFIWNGSVINYTVIYKMRFYPEKGGSSCFNQTVHRDDLVELCSQVLKKISWIGFADFDLIEDPRDKVIKIMEINPRIPACIKASFNSGVNFVENIVNSSIGLPISAYKYKPGSYLRYFGLDLLWFIKSKNRFKTRPSWFKAFLNFNHYFQDGSFTDPLPFIYGTLGGLLKQLDPRFRAAKKGMN
jgi:predicted ATP-grasp superfamily ATP-dependent carboligase